MGVSPEAYATAVAAAASTAPVDMPAAAAAAASTDTPVDTAAAATPIVVGTPIEEPADASKPSDAGKSTEDAKAEEGPKKLDLVFTFDVTGSMGSYIQAAKSNMETIVRQLATQNIDLRFGLVAYRDHPPQDQTFVSKTFDFTTSLAEMKANLGTLSAQGGGDGPEAVEAGLLSTLEMAWRPDATKVCILIADAPPHGLGEGGDGFPEGAPTGVDPLAVIEQMSMQGICIYAVGCQPALSNYRFATSFMIAAAERTNGQAVALGSAAKLADVIMGGAVEECDLQGLMAEMEQQVQQLQAAAPSLGEEEVQAQVWEAMKGRGKKTRQMKAAQLSSDYSGLVTSAPTLGAAKAALAAAAPPPPPASIRSFGGARLEEGMAPKTSRMMRKSSAPMPPPPPGGALCGAPPPPPAARCAMPMMAASMASSAAAPLDDSVEVQEAEISLAQVKRMYAKGKKMGSIRS